MGVFQALLDAVNSHQAVCAPHIEYCKTSWNKLFGDLAKTHSKWGAAGLNSPAKASAPDEFGLGDETMWTFLLALGYAADGVDGVNALSHLLVGEPIDGPEPPKIWLEALPFSPRLREGSTHLDLAVGHIARREERVEEGTLKPRGGIQLCDSTQKTWVAFCEMKCFSDLSTRVTHDLERTQLLRVIDNAIAFQSMNVEGDPRYVDTPVVTLVSPRRLWKGGQRSRLYHFLYRTYQSENGHQALLEDLQFSHESGFLPYRIEKKWRYPQDDLEQRIESLQLRHISFDELYEQMPKTTLRNPILSFFRAWGWGG